MKRGTKRIVVFALLVGPALLGLSVYWFLPRPEVPLAESLPEGELIPHATAEFEPGGPKHPATGNLTLYRDNATNGWFLYFQRFDAKPGQDAWFFLCDHPDPRSRDEIDSGCLRLSVPGHGPADARGDFLVPVPEDVDPRGSGSVVMWDLRFNERHAVAALEVIRPETPEDTQ